jgi:hypothetical protein
MSELVEEERSGAGVVSWPRRHVALAVRAYERGLLGEDALLQTVDDAELVREITAEDVGGDPRDTER